MRGPQYLWQPGDPQAAVGGGWDSDLHRSCPGLAGKSIRLAVPSGSFPVALALHQVAELVSWQEPGWPLSWPQFPHGPGVFQTADSLLTGRTTAPQESHCRWEGVSADWSPECPGWLGWGTPTAWHWVPQSQDFAITLVSAPAGMGTRTQAAGLGTVLDWRY